MTIKASGGSSLARPQLYQTVPLSNISQAEQQDRYLESGELTALKTFYDSGLKRLAIAQAIKLSSQLIVSRAANRIFAGGSPLLTSTNRKPIPMTAISAFPWLSGMPVVPQGSLVVSKICFSVLVAVRFPLVSGQSVFPVTAPAT